MPTVCSVHAIMSPSPSLEVGLPYHSQFISEDTEA